ncbi:hypothetical protein QUF58_05760 [Anaerolineales bacterium HSG24]|nr:hypothetical protein [Anaerolineales bacterium HSG24]
MPTLTVKEFVAKWRQASLLYFTEIQSAQTHFNDICALVGHPDPVAFGDKETFSFEAANIKPNGRKGRADVFYRGRFIWEYKGAHDDLNKAYQQLLFYKDSLDNPPLLITCDTEKIIIHTNYTNTVKQTHVITLDDIEHGNGVRKLKTIFNESIAELDAEFKPKTTREYITQATAEQFIKIVEGVRLHVKGQQLPFNSEEQAHFFIRLLFCLFAESIGLLPNKLFTKLMMQPIDTVEDVEILIEMLSNLFKSMRDGKPYGSERIPHFDGGLFDNEFVPPSLPTSLVNGLLNACRSDWSQLEPSIFGTLFERILDSTKRHQIGAHYTRKADIELIIEPVLMQPLREEWHMVKEEALFLVHHGKQEQAHAILQDFAAKIAQTKVLDPACGSGNFLYIALQAMLDLQKEVLVFAERYDLPTVPLTVDPQQLHGMEINVYAHELAQVTVWIGYIQWRYQNGFEQLPTPILRPLETIKRMDAILSYDEQGQPVEPEWASADVVIGNPPFLGGNRIRAELGDNYVETLFQLYQDRLSAFVDLVCYWFEKARAMIEHGRLQRAGLLSTNSIRGGANRTVLERIKQTGDIFMAWSDREWILDGAAVRVSMIGFDDGTQKTHTLDGKPTIYINSDLSNGRFDLTRANKLSQNSDLVFGGTKKGGNFDISDALARHWRNLSNNSNNKSNRDVVKPWVNGRALVHKGKSARWIIDFGVDMSEEEASQYQQPFVYVKEHVYPVRLKNRQKHRREYWWRHSFTAPSMRAAIAGLERFIATPRVAKYRLFVWLPAETIADDGTYIFARDDDYFFGVLHSKLHELWALRLGTWLGKGNDPRYTPTTCFQTFPFPCPPGSEPSESDSPLVKRIADLARKLVEFRQGWLHPQDDMIGEKVVKKRTLTNLYNALEYYREVNHPDDKAWTTGIEQTLKLGKISAQLFLTLTDIETLDWLHTEIDKAVLDSYGWPHDLTEEQILEKLLALNLERSRSDLCK